MFRNGFLNWLRDLVGLPIVGELASSEPIIYVYQNEPFGYFMAPEDSGGSDVQ